MRARINATTPYYNQLGCPVQVLGIEFRAPWNRPRFGRRFAAETATTNNFEPLEPKSATVVIKNASFRDTTFVVKFWLSVKGSMTHAIDGVSATGQSGQSVVIPANSSVNVNWQINMPSAAGVYDAHVTILWNNTPLVDYKSINPVNIAASLTATDLTVTPTMAVVTKEPGASVAFSAAVANANYIPVTVTVKGWFSGSGGTTTPLSQSLTVPARSSATASLSGMLPTNMADGVYTLNIQVLSGTTSLITKTLANVLTVSYAPTVSVDNITWGGGSTPPPAPTSYSVSFFIGSGLGTIHYSLNGAAFVSAPIGGSISVTAGATLRVVATGTTETPEGGFDTGNVAVNSNLTYTAYFEGIPY